VRGLHKGLTPAILREASKNFFRIGFFEPIMSVMHNKSDGPAPVWKRLLAGMTTGAMGALSCNPFELIKTRMQANANQAIAVGHQHKYKGTISAVINIARTEGIMSLYRGSSMSVIRSMIATGVNLSIYTWTREQVLGRGIMKDSSVTDATCSLFSSFFSALFTNPVDVLRTRVFNQKIGPDGGVLYKNGMDAFIKVVKNEGVRALGKGFFSSFMRMGPHFTLTFVFLEEMKRLSIKEQEWRASNKNSTIQ
jgi:hypothetical protein